MEYIGRHRRAEQSDSPCTHPGVLSLFTDTADYIHCGTCNTLVPRHLL